MIGRDLYAYSHLRSAPSWSAQSCLFERIPVLLELLKLLHYPALPALLFALSLAAEAQSSSRYEALVDVEGLGAISFPNSGAPEAQEAFFEECCFCTVSNLAQPPRPFARLKNTMSISHSRTGAKR